MFSGHYFAGKFGGGAQSPGNRRERYRVFESDFYVHHAQNPNELSIYGGWRDIDFICAGGWKHGSQDLVEQSGFGLCYGDGNKLRGLQ